jgi:1-deoxy-D-xylulose-5-phosphate reductoisomerase
LKKKIAILGSTGSIGTQTLEVINNNLDRFSIELLSAHSNIDLLIKQTIKFKPKTIIIGNKNHYKKLKMTFKSQKINILYGEDALNNFYEYCNVDLVVISLVGKLGLIPTINAIKNKVDIAFANKETLVIAGSIINKLLIKHSVNLYPIDSEHSAIFQCLIGESEKSIEKIILTASGGPFRGKTLKELKNVTKADALNHPKWKMGNKITIDSSTLMNKGLELIEAKWLFNIDINKIEVVLHPESIIHSMVQFIDGSIKAQLGEPNMKIPIQYALSYPKRIKNNFPRYKFDINKSLNFEKPCLKTFNNLKLAFNAAQNGGNAPCILNASNEIVVESFLKEKIKFLDMTNIIEESLNKISYIANPNLEELIETDYITRNFTKKIINNL